MSFFSRPEHEAVWRLARPYLQVRDNDVHTLHAYALGRVLLQAEPTADAETVLVAILLHDTGWSQMPHDKIKQAIGPNALYPELQRGHELAGMAIARGVLGQLDWPADRLQRVVDIVDGHDTRKHALSLEDALMKDADKLWRFTPHGIGCIADWFDQTEPETVDLLESYVCPQLLRPETLRMAQAYLATARTTQAASACLA